MGPFKTNPTIHFGIVNPKGDDDYTSTTYYTKHQLKLLAPLLRGFPLHINHVTENERGEPIEPSGMILHGHIHSKTGALWVAFVRFDTPNGELAGCLLGENGILPEDLRMSELSLGYKVMKTMQADGFMEPTHNSASEVSICWKGARENTEIRKRFKLDEVLKISQKKDYINKEEDRNKLNISSHNNKSTDQSILQDKEQIRKQFINMATVIESLKKSTPIIDLGGAKGLDKDMFSFVNGDNQVNEIENSLMNRSTQIIETQASQSSHAPPANNIPLTSNGALSQLNEQMIKNLLEQAMQQNGNAAAVSTDYIQPASDVKLDLNKYNEFLAPPQDEAPPDTTGMTDAQRERTLRDFNEKSELKKRMNRSQEEEIQRKKARIQDAGTQWLAKLTAEGDAQNKNIRQYLPGTEKFLAGLSAIDPSISDPVIGIIEAQASLNTVHEARATKAKMDAQQVQQAHLKALEEKELENKKLKEELEKARQNPQNSLFPQRSPQVNNVTQPQFPQITGQPQGLNQIFPNPQLASYNANSFVMQNQPTTETIQTQASRLDPLAKVFYEASLKAGKHRLPIEAHQYVANTQAAVFKRLESPDPANLKLKDIMPANYKNARFTSVTPNW